MASNIAKPDKFEGVDFRRWKKKTHFSLSSVSMVYVLTTPIPNDGDDATVDQLRKRAKWDNDNYDSLEAKYMAEDASSKKFLVSNFTNYKMADSRPVLEQYNKLLGILRRFTQHKINMDEAIQFSCIIDKLPLSWKDFKHTLKHKKKELTFVELGSHLRIEESLRMQDSDKPKGNNVVGPSVVNIVEHNNSSRYNENKGKRKHHDNTKADPNKKSKVYYVTYVFEAYFVQDDDVAWTESRVLGAVVRLPDPKLKPLCERGIECIFVRYVEHSKAFRFYVIEPNDSVSINSIIESRDAIFDKNRFSSVPRPSLRIPNETKDIGGSVVLKEVTKEVVQQPEPELRKSKRNRNPKNFGPGFQLYLIEGTRDEVSDQHSYCFNVEDDPKIFDEEMKSQDVGFWKEAINDEIDSIMGNNTWALADLPPGIDYFDTYAPVACISTIRLLIAMASIHNLIIHQMDVKIAFLDGELEEEVYMNQPQGFIMSGNENKVCKLIKSLYGLKQAPKQWHQKFDEVVLSNGYLLNQADKCVYIKFNETSKGVISCLYVDDMLIFGTNQVQVDLTKEFSSSRFSMKDMGEADVILVSTPMDTSGKLMPNNGQVVSQLEYSWASKKQTCITGSTMEFEFMALVAAGKEA
ncbi:zinc finger, CCHC-type containing protein [Tanacetum coccineum]